MKKKKAVFQDFLFSPFPSTNRKSAQAAAIAPATDTMTPAKEAAAIGSINRLNGSAAILIMVG